MAPAYLRAAKATAELYNIAETPNAAAVVWNKSPVHRPDAVDIPAFLPWEMLIVRTKMISGPGNRVRATDAKMKYRSCAGSINYSPISGKSGKED